MEIISLKRRMLFAFTLLSLLLYSICSGPALAMAEPSSQHSLREVQAAYLYNFLLFMHWPEKITAKTITICVMGDDQIFDLLAPISGKPIKGMPQILAVKKVDKNFLNSKISSCVLLFISKEAWADMGKILSLTKGKPILTVSDAPNFINDGGMLGLITKKGKVRWQINQRTAKESGMRFASQLLRNADTVINREVK